MSPEQTSFPEISWDELSLAEKLDSLIRVKLITSKGIYPEIETGRIDSDRMGLLALSALEQQKSPAVKFEGNVGDVSRLASDVVGAYFAGEGLEE